MKNLIKLQLLCALSVLAPLCLIAKTWTSSEDNDSDDIGCINCKKTYQTQSNNQVKAPRSYWQEQFQSTQKPHEGLNVDAANRVYFY